MGNKSKQLMRLMAVLGLCLGLMAMPSYGKSRKSKKSSKTTTTEQSSNSETAKSPKSDRSRSSKKAEAAEQNSNAKMAGSSGSGMASNSSPQATGGNGMVWVNTSSKVYHVKGDRWYGKTKNGKYMSEAEAVKEGYHAAGHGGRSKSSH
ncbi:MAG: hypothetical protein KGM47_17005 [Acidobacteriota bacterium]|nr:hypothetical protein [Acidobacteriota bacterium]